MAARQRSLPRIGAMMLRRDGSLERTPILGRVVIDYRAPQRFTREVVLSRASGIPSFLNGQDFGVFPRFGPTQSAQIG